MIWWGDQPASGQVRDANLLLCISNIPNFSTLGPSGNAIGPIWINVDPFQSRWVRWGCSMAFLVEGWFLFFWGVQKKYEAYVEWLHIGLVGMNLGAADTANMGEEPVTWISQFARGSLAMGWLAIAFFSLCSFLEVVLSSWSHSVGMWPLSQDAGMAVANVAASTGGVDSAAVVAKFYSWYGR